jgi:hypothetical protein
MATAFFDWAERQAAVELFLVGHSKMHSGTVAVSTEETAIGYLLAPAVRPPRQYFPSRINAATSGRTLINEPSAIR